MNFKKYNAWIFAYLVLISTFMAVMVGFDGVVTLEISPFSFRVIVDSNAIQCIADPEFINDSLETLHAP